MTDPLLSGLISFRDIEQGDMNYVYGTMMRNYRQFDHNSHIHKEDYKRDFGIRLALFLERKSTLIRLAVLPEDPTSILGFIIFSWQKEPRYLVLHFVYVRGTDKRHKGARELGIARALVSHLYHPSKPIVLSTFNRAVPSFLNKYSNASYNPHAILEHE